MDKITHEMRLMQWVPIIRECRGSGMTVKAWCLENNVNENNFTTGSAVSGRRRLIP